MSLEIVSLIMTTVVVFEYLIGRGYKQVVFFSWNNLSHAKYFRYITSLDSNVDRRLHVEHAYRGKKPMLHVEHAYRGKKPIFSIFT
jgi:hypothetical protein